MDWMKRPSMQPTRCASSQPFAMVSRWTPPQSCTSFSRWHIEQLDLQKLEIRVMRNTNWIVTAGLLLSLSAAAQQPADSQPPSDPAAAQTSAPAPQQTAPAQSAPAAQPAPAPIAAPASKAQGMPAPPKAEAQPTTMDQVVDRFVL